jgi:hypothetical protein
MLFGKQYINGGQSVGGTAGEWRTPGAETQGLGHEAGGLVLFAE